MMMKKPDACIVRIFDQYNAPVGGGFLFNAKKAVTCAHVVKSALGAIDDPTQTPRPQLDVDFPQSRVNNAIKAYVDVWDPKNDIALLSLSGQIPSDIIPVQLINEQDLWDHAFRAFGFPKGYDHGIWASGVLRGRTANQWLQIESESSYIVQPGFSGSPVFDEQAGGVVGMVNVADRDLRIRAAFVIPTDILLKEIPGLHDNVPRPVRRLSQIYDLSKAELQEKLKFHRSRISSRRKPDDLLSASLISLMLKSFDESIQFQEHFLSERPLHAYGWYALALAGLRGRRPRILTYDQASVIHEQVLKAVQIDASLTQAVLLLALLTDDYFQSKGFQVNPNLGTCLRLIQGKTIERKEVMALLEMIPNDHSIHLIQAIRSSIL